MPKRTCLFNIVQHIQEDVAVETRSQVKLRIQFKTFRKVEHKDVWYARPRDKRNSQTLNVCKIHVYTLSFWYIICSVSFRMIMILVTSTLVSLKTVTGHNLMCHLMDICYMGKGRDTLPKTNSSALKASWLEDDISVKDDIISVAMLVSERLFSKLTSSPKSTKSMTGFACQQKYMIAWLPLIPNKNERNSGLGTPWISTNSNPFIW